VNGPESLVLMLNKVVSPLVPLGSNVAQLTGLSFSSKSAQVNVPPVSVGEGSASATHSTGSVSLRTHIGAVSMDTLIIKHVA